MNEDDKATTVIPETAAHAKLEKLDQRDKMIRLVEVAILLVVVAFNVFIGLRIQSLINQNQAASVQRSQQASSDRQNIKDYIKCLSLLRFNVEPSELQNKEAVTAALDSCANAGN